MSNSKWCLRILFDKRLLVYREEPKIFSEMVIFHMEIAKEAVCSNQKGWRATWSQYYSLLNIWTMQCKRTRVPFKFFTSQKRQTYVLCSLASTVLTQLLCMDFISKPRSQHHTLKQSRRWKPKWKKLCKFISAEVVYSLDVAVIPILLKLWLTSNSRHIKQRMESTVWHCVQ